jgi:hypothetical protein
MNHEYKCAKLVFRGVSPPVLDFAFTCIFATAHILHKINAFSESDPENILN